jgi:hypothetical protein
MGLSCLNVAFSNLQWQSNTRTLSLQSKDTLQYFLTILVVLYVAGGFVFVTSIVRIIAGLRHSSRSDLGSNFDGCFSATC